MRPSEHFSRGRAYFKASKYQEAVGAFSEAIALDSSQFIFYDCRAAAYERLDRLPNALSDAKTTINVAPQQLHGYIRSARLFLKAGKPDSSLVMLDLAHERVKEGDSRRHAEMAALKAQALHLCNSHICHMEKLPVELIVHVFRFCAHPVVPVVVSHVNRRWRAIALNTPALWSSLLLRSPRSLARRLKAWTRRSNEKFTVLDVGHKVEPHAVFESLSPQSVRNLRVLIMECRDCNLIPLDTFGAFHVLENFHLIAYDHPFPANMLLELRSNSLLNMSLQNVTFLWSVIAQTFTTLRSLKILDSRPEDETNILSAIEANPFLEEVLVNYPSRASYFPQVLPVPDLPLILERLSSLSIDLASVSSRLFLGVSVPALQSLHLVNSHSSIDAILDRMSQQDVILRELRLNRCVVSAIALIKFLDKMPSIRTLEVSDSTNVANPVMEALASPIERSPSDHPTDQPGRSLKAVVCPSLSYLNLSFCSDLKTGPLIRLVASRIVDLGKKEIEMGALPTPIASLTVDRCPLVEADALPWLHKNVPQFRCRYMHPRKSFFNRIQDGSS